MVDLVLILHVGSASSELIYKFRKLSPLLGCVEDFACRSSILFVISYLLWSSGIFVMSVMRFERFRRYDEASPR